MMLPESLSKRIIISFIFFIVIAVAPAYTQSSGGRQNNSVFFIAYGRLIKVDFSSKRIFAEGAFHRTAKYYSVSPGGSVWSRLDYTHIGAINPGMSGAAGRPAGIRLPFRPYMITILPDGTGYISHQILTDKGFPLSVVDTQKKKLLRVIYHIKGIVTDLIHAHGIVYFSTYGFRPPHTLRIYRLMQSDNRAKEIYSLESADYKFKLAVFKDILYVPLLPGRAATAEPEMKLIDLSGNMIASLGRKRLGEIAVILDKPFFYRERGYLPCRTRAGAEGIAVYSVKKQSVVDMLPLQSSIYGIIGIQNDTIAYINIHPDVGRGELTLYFYSIKGRKEVKHIKVLPVIRQTDENKN